MMLRGQDGGCLLCAGISNITMVPQLKNERKRYLDCWNKNEMKSGLSVRRPSASLSIGFRERTVKPTDERQLALPLSKEK